MRISIIAAVADNGVIGLEGTMPWNIPGDLTEFRRQTMGHPIIMGRKTFEKTGVLPGRDNIVLTRSPMAMQDTNHYVVHSWEAAREAAEALGGPNGAKDMFVCGGAEVYHLAMPHADRLCITWLTKRVDGDTYFPAINPIYWRDTRRKTYAYGEYTQYERE